MVVGLAFAMGWPLVLAAISPNQNLRDLRQDGIVLAAEWISLLVLYAIVTGLERQPFFATVGWRAPRPRDWIIIAWLAILAAALCVILAKQHATMPVRGSILAQVYGVPIALRAAMVFTAGICEETLFRGYAIERLKLLAGNIWLAGLIATVLFTLAHIPRYGLSMGLVGVGGIAVALALLYIWRRNIWPCVALHWFVDGISLLIIPAFVTPR
jgi:uncharacterized protein